MHNPPACVWASGHSLCDHLYHCGHPLEHCSVIYECSPSFHCVTGACINQLALFSVVRESTHWLLNDTCHTDLGYVHLAELDADSAPISTSESAWNQHPVNFNEKSLCLCSQMQNFAMDVWNPRRGKRGVTCHFLTQILCWKVNEKLNIRAKSASKLH